MPKQGTVHHDDDPGSVNDCIGYLKEEDTHRTRSQYPRPGGRQVEVTKYKPYIRKDKGITRGHGDDIKYELKRYLLTPTEDHNPDCPWIWIAEIV